MPVSFISDAFHFLWMYIRQYYGLMIFLAAFVVCYILLMHRPNSPLFNKLREPTALLGFGIEIVTIVYFTLMFRDSSSAHSYELELFWSYKEWIIHHNAALGMEILNNILLFFPLGFIMTDAFRKCPLRIVCLVSLILSGAVECCQLIFRLGLFEFDDILNNVLGAVLGWCVFHLLKNLRSRKRKRK